MIFIVQVSFKQTSFKVKDDDYYKTTVHKFHKPCTVSKTAIKSFFDYHVVSTRLRIGLRNEFQVDMKQSI